LCFFANANFKSCLLGALALEWSAPAEAEIVYRSSMLEYDDFYQEGEPQSLSFSRSLLSGMFFDFSACTLHYYGFQGRTLFAMQLSPAALKRYFFMPAEMKNYKLISLVAKGEFSHPRLRILKSEADRIRGVCDEYEEAKKLTCFDFNAKIHDQAAFEKKIRRKWQKGLVILADPLGK
jgi:hypothetical protein